MGGKRPPRCPHCGSSNFRVTQERTEELIVAPNSAGGLIIVARRSERIVSYEWIYCEICGLNR